MGFLRVCLDYLRVLSKLSHQLELLLFRSVQLLLQLPLLFSHYPQVALQGLHATLVPYQLLFEMLLVLHQHCHFAVHQLLAVRKRLDASLQILDFLVSLHQLLFVSADLGVRALQLVFLGPVQVCRFHFRSSLALQRLFFFGFALQPQSKLSRFFFKPSISALELRDHPIELCDFLGHFQMMLRYLFELVLELLLTEQVADACSLAQNGLDVRQLRFDRQCLGIAVHVLLHLSVVVDVGRQLPYFLQGSGDTLHL